MLAAKKRITKPACLLIAPLEISSWNQAKSIVPQCAQTVTENTGRSSRRPARNATMDGPYAEAKEQRQQRPTALELLRRDRSRYQVMFGQEVPGGVVHFSQRFLIGDLCLDHALLRLRELVLGIEHEKNCLGAKLILTFFR